MPIVCLFVFTLSPILISLAIYVKKPGMHFVLHFFLNSRILLYRMGWRYYSTRRILKSYDSGHFLFRELQLAREESRVLFGSWTLSIYWPLLSFYNEVSIILVFYKFEPHLDQHGILLIFLQEDPSNNGQWFEKYWISSSPDGCLFTEDYFRIYVQSMKNNRIRIKEDEYLKCIGILK